MKNRKKILIIGNTKSPLTHERGQIGLKDGYDIHWISYSKDKIKNIQMYYLPAGKNTKLKWIKRLIFLWFKIRKIKPDLFHVFWADHYFLNILLSRCSPLIVTVMGSDIMPDKFRLRSKLNRKLITNLLNRAQIITSKSHFMDQRLAAMIDNPKKIRRITWGVDLQLFKQKLSTHSLRKKLGIPSKTWIFSSLRNCRPLYNHHTVIQAFYRILKKYDLDSYLLISTFLAEKDYFEDLKSLTVDLEISSRVIFLDPIPHEKMPLYFNLSQCSISIPSSEGMPQSLFETMACGCFPILGDLPQYKEIISNKKTGIIVPLNDPESLAEAMVWTVKNPEALHHAAISNRRKVEDIADKNKEIHAMLDIYKKYLNDESGL
ncbi:MAG: glycosyltransferase family 4 protein [Candidatus Aminicenantes bacterium]|nr:glycosyltransferase family 4 protein [Candidatus Aminicenantes bacterium]